MTAAIEHVMQTWVLVTGSLVVFVCTVIACACAPRRGEQR